MTSRPLLALGLAVLAVSASTVATVAPANAADRVASETTAPHLTKGQLRGVDTIRLRAESLELEQDDDTVATLPMQDSRGTVRVLDRLLGTPSRTQTAEGDGGACFPAGTTYTWGGAIRVAALSTPASLGNAVEIRVLRDEVRTRTGERVSLVGPHGVQVGDDIADRIDDAPRADREAFGSDDDDPSAWQLLLQRGWQSDDDSEDGADVHNGVSALTNGTTVAVMGTPMPVNARRSC